jgi:PAS domain S-box-containing protein
MIEENGGEKQPDPPGYVKRRACSEAKRAPFVEGAPFRHLGAVPIPVFIATIVVLRYLESESLTSGLVFDPPLLLPVLNGFFLGIIPFAIAYVSARSYLLNGSRTLLYLGSGLLVLSSASPIAGSLIGVPGGTNLNVTIYNTGVLATSILLFLCAISVRSKISDARASRKLRLTVAYSGAVLFVGLFTAAALHGVIPVFFVQGVGPTLLRQVVLGSATLLFAVCSLQSARTYVKSRISFAYWYALGLALVSIGLSAVFLQSSVGGLSGWGGRSAQYLGGIYLAIALLALRREITVVGAPLQDALVSFFRESEKNYRVLTETALDAIVFLNAEGRVLLWNRAAERIFGWSRSEAVGSSLVELIIPDQQADTARERFGKSAADVMLGKAVEIEAKRKDGSRITVEVSISTGDSPTGKIITTVIRDTTERKRMEETLRESEKRFRHISSVISDIAYFCVKPPNGSYSIDWMVGAVEPVTGYSMEEIKAQGCWRFLVVDEDLALFEKWVTGLARGSAGFCELRLRHKSGDTVWVESSAECVTEGENPERLRLYGGLVDITERKRIENKQAALHRHATRLNSVSTIDEVVENTLDAMELTLGFDHADFDLVEDGFVRIKGSRGMPVWPSELPLDGPGVVVKAANTGRTLRVPDTRKEPAFVEARAAHEKAEPLGILSELTVPVLVGDQTVAVLNVESTRVDAFSEQDQMLLETLAMHVSSALSRLKQMESLERLVFERTRKLAESERRFRELSDLLPQIVFEIDENGNIQYMNRAGFAATGISEEEFSKGDLNAFHFLVVQEFI